MVTFVGGPLTPQVLKKLVVKVPVDVKEPEEVGVPLMVNVEVPIPENDTPGMNPPVAPDQLPPDRLSVIVEIG